MQLNNMPNHQPSAGGTDHPHHPMVDPPSLRLVSASVPISIPLFRLRNVSFLPQQVDPMAAHPLVEPEPNGSATNNNNYDFYKPSATNGLEHEPGHATEDADQAKIKLETSDGEGPDGFHHIVRPESSDAGSNYGTQESQSSATPPLSVVPIHRTRRPDDEDADEEDEDERMVMEGPEPRVAGEEEDEEEEEEESNDTGGAVERCDDSEQDDNKLAPQDQEKMTQAVKKVFTEYKWTPPVAPIR
uniref:Uncharacterized protein n=1 Tax=Anopheles maculatus TaxID=74869 RepID=A0A182SAU2_9DIPT